MKMDFPKDSPIWLDDSSDGQVAPLEKSKGAKEHKMQAPSIEKELRRLILVLKNRELYPCIVFSFSRRECEAYAQFIACPQKKKQKSDEPDDLIDLNSEEEKAAVQSIFDAALQCLDEQDRNLPCIESMLPMLLRGVGVHHSGLLPILKEIVELLFQENLVKCLFSTETFAMGLNMPAKTVVFTSLTKWDGQMTRPLSSGEYIQMSGRAGRRGKDDRGFTMLMIDQNLTKADCKEMLKGEASRLNSSFKLSYYTLLNLIRSRSLGRKDDMEYVISKSFQQFQHEQAVPNIQSEVDSIREKAKALTLSQEEIEEFTENQRLFREVQKRKMGYLLNPNACLHLLRPGRIVRVYAGDTDWHYGVLLRLRRIEDSQISDPKNYVADVMLCCAIDGNSTFPCSFEDTRSSMLVVPVPLPSISEISCLRITLPSNLKDIKAKKSVKNTLKSLMSKYPAQKLPQLDPLADFNVVERDTKELEKILDEEKQVASRIEILEVWQVIPFLMSNRYTDNIFQHLQEKYGQGLSVQLREAAQLQNIASKKELEISRSPLKKFEEEFKQRKDVLRKLGHIDEDDTVTLKGRAASQIDTGDELLITELMFDGTFGSLDEHELASLLSCMVPVENSQV